MKYRRLSAAEREDISQSVSEKMSLREAARRLGRAPSTISREIKRLRHRHRVYQPIFSQWNAEKQASSRRQHKRKLLLNPRLLELVKEFLRQDWSPQQIEKHLKLNYKADMQVSKESIYTYLYVFLRRNMREEFIKHLRQQRKRRRKVRVKVENPTESIVLGKIELIDERPVEANDRLIPGHWEGDLIIGNGRKQTALGTLVGRTTRFVILVPLKTKTADEVREEFAKAINKLPSHLKRSLTYDQGSEMRQHRLFTKQTEMKVFFCNPRSPWERGTNENTNGLLRQYFPKNIDFTKVSEPEIRRVEKLLNGRPRKTLDWRTPAERMELLLR